MGVAAQAEVLRGVLTTFGPGSMVDLPDHAVLIGGLDHWHFAERKRVYEERLESSSLPRTSAWSEARRTNRFVTQPAIL